jgi:drug/metabolite transporter (DMT)-like permease
MSIGIITTLGAATLASSKDLVSKKLASVLDGTASSFASFLFALPFYVLLLTGLWLMGKESFMITTPFLILVVLRAITDSATEWFKMSAFSVGDISLVAPIIALFPIFLLVVSPIINHDQVSTSGTLAVIVAVIGSLVLVWKPSTGIAKGQGKAVGLGLACALFMALNNCFDREAVKIASPAISGFAMTLLSALLLAPLVIFRRDRLLSLSQNRRPLLVRGFLEVAFMVTKLSALQFLPVQYVSGILRISVVFSMIGGRVFFREGDFLRRLIGALLIVSGVVAIIFEI